jgi:hypothetical protein
MHSMDGTVGYFLSAVRVPDGKKKPFHINFTWHSLNISKQQVFGQFLRSVLHPNATIYVVTEPTTSALRTPIHRTAPHSHHMIPKPDPTPVDPLTWGVSP